MNFWCGRKKPAIFFWKIRNFCYGNFSTKASCSRTLSVCLKLYLCLKHRKARCALLICTSFNTITTTLQPCFQLMALLRHELHNAIMYFEQNRILSARTGCWATVAGGQLAKGRASRMLWASMQPCQASWGT